MSVFLLYNAPAFTSKSCESQKWSWKCARAFWRIAKRSQKESFCWKSSILTRWLNRVGFEFWDLSRNHKGHVSAVKCCQLIDLSSGTPWISKWSFCPFWLFCSCASTSTCALLPPTHTHVFVTYSSTLPPPTSLYLSLLPSSLFATMVCVPLCIVWPHCAHGGLDQRSNRNCGAAVGSGGWQGGQGDGKWENEREWITHTPAYGWQDGLKEEAPCGLSSPSLDLRLVPHIAWGLAWTAPFFSPLFPLWKSFSRGAKCKKNTWFLLCNAPVFTSKSCESQKRSWECARDF